MNNPVEINLTGNYGINIGSNYEVNIQLCNAPDLTPYSGICQIKKNNIESDVILSPTIVILTKDIFQIKISFTDFVSTIEAGSYFYDVLMAKTDDRFYAVYGKCQLIKRVTAI